jgi:GTP cyclohydrolase IA
MGRAEELFQAWLDEVGFGEDPEMAATAHRFTEMFHEFAPRPIEPLLESFTLVAVTSPPGAPTTPVSVRSMPFYAFCAHHLVPFFGHASVAYVPDRTLAGFGSIARVVQHFAQRPTLQEHLAENVANALYGKLAPKGLVVRLHARQMCMEMRGAKVPGEVEVLAVRGTVDASLLDMARVN